MATDYTGDANCRAAYLFADDLTDESADSNDLTASGGATYSVDVPKSYVAKSLDLNSATPDHFERSYATLSANFPGKFNGKEDMAFAIWMKRDRSGAIGNHEWFISCAYNWNCGFTVNTDWLWIVIYDEGGTSYYWNDEYQWTTTGAWFHIAFSFDGSATQGTLWISDDTTFGSEVNGATETFTNVDDVRNDSPESFCLGARYDGAVPLDGHIAQPIVFDRTIIAAEAEEIYTYGIDGSGDVGGGILQHVSYYQRRRNYWMGWEKKDSLWLRGM